MTDAGTLDAERFAEALETIEAGGEADLDPREDPTLAGLTRLASRVCESARRATATARFDSYRARSRAAVLHRVARERAAAEAARPRGVPFFRLSFLTPVASAAAAAAAALAFVALQPDGAPAPAAPPAVQAAAEPPVTPPVPIAPGAAFAPGPQPRGPALPPGIAGGDEAAIPAAAPAPLGLDPLAPEDPVEPGQEERAVEIFVGRELLRIDALIAALGDRVALDQPVDPALLRGVTESILAVAWHIENQPDGVLHAQVVSYIKAAADTRILLAAAYTGVAEGKALSAARRASQDGVAVAAWYFTYY